jgi:hypothetical protein
LANWTGVKTSFTSDPVNNFFAQFDHQAIFEALLNDCPYDLYWFDKTQGYAFGAGTLGNRVTRIVAVMSVSVGYQATNYNPEAPVVSVGQTVSKSVANAKAIVDKYIKYLAAGITNTINIFQPDVLCIGGGVCNEGDALLLPVKAIVMEEVYTRNSPKNTEIVIAKLGNDAGIIGAAFLGRANG